MENEKFKKEIERIDNIIATLTSAIVAILILDIIIMIVFIQKNF